MIKNHVSAHVSLETEVTGSWKIKFPVWDCKVKFDILHMECFQLCFIAGSLEAAYSLNWGAREIWGKGGGETLALL